MATKQPFFKPKPVLRQGTCLNCGSNVTGKFCSQCGQELTDRHVRFAALLGEGISEFFNWDSKLLRSLRPLLFKPGFLTREYVEGRRVRYVAPIRFYLIGSLLFFLIFDPSLSPETLSSASSKEGREALEAETGRAFRGSDSLGAGPGPDSSAATTNLPLPEAVPVLPFDTVGVPEEEKANHPQTDSIRMEAGGDGTRPQVDTTGGGKRIVSKKKQTGVGRFGIYTGDESDTTSFFGQFAHQVNKRVEKDNGFGLLNMFLKNIPTILFFMMPFAALCLWLVQIRRGHDYMEHLVFTLHMHAFIYFCLLLLYGLDKLAVWQLGWEEFVVFGVGMVVLPLYFYKALRYFYGQSRWRTLLKMFLVVVLYYMVNLFVTIAGFLIATYLYIQ